MGASTGTVMAALATVPPTTCDVAGLNVGLIEEMTGTINRPGVRRVLSEAVRSLTEAGAIVSSVSVPDAGGALAAYLDLTAATGATLLEPWWTVLANLAGVLAISVPDRPVLQHPGIGSEH